MNGKENRVPHCSECEYLKMYDIMYTCYYCDHEGRENDMGKLGIDHTPKTSPEWCPKRKSKIISASHMGFIKQENQII